MPYQQRCTLSRDLLSIIFLEEVLFFSDSGVNTLPTVKLKKVAENYTWPHIFTKLQRVCVLLSLLNLRIYFQSFRKQLHCQYLNWKLLIYVHYSILTKGSCLCGGTQLS